MMFILNIILSVHLALSAPFSDGVVLQSGKPIPVKGTAEPGAKVKVSFGGSGYRTMAAADSSWCVIMNPSRVCSKPRTMKVKSGKDRLIVSDILVGEVWLASGQSNMAFRIRTLKKADSDSLKALSEPMVRAYLIPPVVMGGKFVERNDVGWSKMGEDEIDGWSAVATYFALEIRKRYPDTPVGIIMCAQGSATAEAYLSDDYIAAHPEIKDSFMKDVNGIAANYRNPGRLYGPMLAPVAGYPLRGFLWYQGEGNHHQPQGYRVVFPALIDNWRQVWNDQELPFLFAEISTYYKTDEEGRARWKEIQKIQSEVAASVPNTGIALTDDLGDPKDIHPKNKKPVAERLYVEAARIVYK